MHLPTNVYYCHQLFSMTSMAIFVLVVPVCFFHAKLLFHSKTFNKYCDMFTNYQKYSGTEDTTVNKIDKIPVLMKLIPVIS